MTGAKGRREVIAGLAALAGSTLLQSPTSLAAKETNVGGIELKVRRRLRHDGVLSVAWSPDGTKLVSAGYPYKLWNPHTGEKLHELGPPFSAFVVSAPVRFTADGKHVVVVSDNARIGDAWTGFGLWNVETGLLDRQVPFPTKYFSPKKAGDPWFIPIPGKKQAVVIYIKNHGWPVLIYDTETWEVIGAPIRLPQGGATDFDVSPDGRLLAVGNRMWEVFVGNPTGRIELYDLVSGKLVQAIDRAHKDVTGHVKFSPDGKYIASSQMELGMRILNTKTNELEDMNDLDPVRLWEISSGNKGVSFEGPFPGTSNLAFHPIRPWVAASLGTITGKTKGPEFRVWDWKNGTQLAVENQFTSSAESIEFSPDGRFVAMAGNNKECFHQAM
ncbi:MAG: hypothetical protein HQL43_03580 [Alphaproteobacteria bacterium]|nr:hypothetical protein [Alphaproteobacteria bacterium]